MLVCASGITYKNQGSQAVVPDHLKPHLKPLIINYTGEYILIQDLSMGS
jgi:hypothetical protein